jgi:hypothetical protein
LHTVGRRWRTHALPRLGVLVAYALLALILTWPVASHIGTHVPGNGADDPPLTWNLWWVRYALLDLGANPFDCDYLFYPLGINLAFYTLTVLNGLLSIPLQAVVGLVAASNLLLFSSFVLSAYGAFLLAAYLLARDSNPDARNPIRRSLIAPFGAGLLYGFASSKLSYAALGQWNIASSQWIPFYVLYLFKMWDEPGRWRNAVLVALTFLLQAYAELTYASFLLLFTALWLIWQVLAQRRALAAAKLPRFAGGLALAIAISLAGLLPVLLMMVPDLLAEGDIFVEGGGFADVFSADLLGFLVPTMYHPLLGSLVERFSFDHSVGQHIYLGYSALFLAVVGFATQWRRSTPPPSSATSREGRHVSGFWALSTLVFWLLTLGPTLRVNGHDTGLPLPFALVAQLPFFKGNRYPSRYSVLLVLSLAMLVAYGLAAIASWWKARSTAARWPMTRTLAPLLLISLLLFEHLSIPLPLSDMRVPAVYQVIADEMPGDWTLLDLPVAWRNGFRVTGTQHPIIMFEQYYQTVHGKRILAGNTSRNPPLKFQYFVEAPVINTLIALETGHAVDPTIVEADRALAADVLRFFNIEAVVIHPAQTGPDVIPYVEATMPVELFRDDGEILAYRVDLPPWPETWTIEPGGPLGRLSFAEGWGVPSDGAIWAQRRAARLLVPLNGEAQRLAFRAYAPEEGQRLRLEINGQRVQSMAMTAGWSDYQVPLPADVTQPGLNEVWLYFETLYPASQVALSRRTIGQTGVEAPANLVVQSAGLEVGDFGNVFVDGRNVSPNERGYNVAVIDPQSGSVDQTATFDTHLDKGASQALASFLADVPPGTVVAVAAADEASRLLSQEAVDALRGIGATGDLRGKFRWGHAIIGVQGAPPATALEALDWMRPVHLVAGEGATEPELAAGFAAITFTATPDP